MIVSIHQPQYLPRMQFFDKIAKSDLFVFMDDVQFSNNNFQHYNFIEGRIKLKLPLKYHFGDLINSVRLANMDWVKNHTDIIKSVYAKEPFCDAVLRLFDDFSDCQTLSDVSCRIIRTALKEFDIRTPVIMASSLKAVGKKQERVIDICKKLGASVYLSGMGASAYQSQKDFEDAGIELTYIQNDHGFNNLSFVDYVVKNNFIYERGAKR